MSSIFANQQENIISDRLMGDAHQFKQEESPRKREAGAPSGVQDLMMAGGFDFSSGNVFSKATFNCIGDGALLQNDLQWDNNQIPLLSRGPSLTTYDQHMSKKFKLDDTVVADMGRHQGALLGAQDFYPSSASLFGQLSTTGQSDISQFLNSSTSFQAATSSHSRHEETNGTQSLILSLVPNQTNKKRTRREQKEEEKACKTKKSAPQNEDSYSAGAGAGKKKTVTFHTSKVAACSNDDTTIGGRNESTIDEFQRLSNKKREYLEETIEDKNGRFAYDEDPNEYKKARKRMQNRESAVRSRMRKKYHQDDLEGRIEELEMMHKEVSQQNAGLAAQNALLKKQLSYFEDIFAKSSLLGSDPSAVNKNDLERFQKNLLKKINKRLFSDGFEEDLNESNPLDESLGILPSKRGRNILEDVDTISSTSISNPLPLNLHSAASDDRLESLRLVRSRSNSSSFSNTGYLFLAVVFCMMCCSSVLVTPSNMIKMASQTQVFSKIINSGDFVSQRKLMSAGVQQNSVKAKQQNSAKSLSSPLNEDAEMTEETETLSIHGQNSEGDQELGAVNLMRMMLQGQYTYLTYMILSTTCFFFWLMPNCHKIRRLFSFSSRRESIHEASRYRQPRNQNRIQTPERQILTRAQAAKGVIA